MSIITLGLLDGDIVTLGIGEGDAPLVETEPQFPKGVWGRYGYFRGKRKRSDREELFDELIELRYAAIIEEAPKVIQAKAAKIVRPYVKTLTLAVPKPGNIDWVAFDKDLQAVEALNALFASEMMAREDEEFLLMAA